MQIRDRIKEFRRVPANQLRPHPRNWRTHPPAQREAMRGVLAEIGFAGALLARELPDGALELIDGHLRAETTPTALVPVLVLDLDASEALKLLASFDPLSQMAQTDPAALSAVLAEVDTENNALREMLANLAPQPENPTTDRCELPDLDLAASLWQVVVECEDEAGQRAVYEQLSGQGYSCRLLNL